MATTGKANFPPQIDIPASLKPAGTQGPRLLEIERSKASFSSQAMKEYLHGKAYLDRQARILAVVEKEEAFDKSTIHYLSRSEKFRHALRKEKRLEELKREHDWDEQEFSLADNLVDLPAQMGLHRTMGLKTLTNQGTEEQHKLFLEKAKNNEIITCYAQTELGHGSNVQGLETTCTYDPATKEFIVHSPSLTACKWWIGGLGRTADHAVVMAQLWTNGKHYGPHPILVPIRDPKTREPLPGRIIFDIGPKVGYNATDNGALLLDNVRVPHVYFLAKYSQVDPETGDYIKPKNAKLAYGTMTYIRATIVQNARMVMARSATVAVRYCAVRRQFADRDAPVTDDGKISETAVLNYQLVQYRIFPIIAQALACHFTGREMFRLYNENQQAMEEGDFGLLADTHASSSGLKSLVTIMAAEAIETCRRACGGHGFSMAAGLGAQYQDYLPQVTWEGDSYLLTQQCGRYLFKTFRSIWNDRKAEFSEHNITATYIRKYLENVNAKAKISFSGDFHDPQMFVDAFGHRAAYLIGQAVRKRDIERQTWNSLLVDIFRCSSAHCQFILVSNFAQAIMHDEALKSQKALHFVFQQNFELFACHTMAQEGAEFLASGYLDAKQFELLGNQRNLLLASLRPQAVSLVDGFAVPDYLLNSALGKYDGDVYPALVDFAIREPLNGHNFNVDYKDLELAIGEPKLSKL